MKIRTYKVCMQCIQDLKDMRHYSEHGTQKLPASPSFPHIAPQCPQLPRCFDQPQRIKRIDLDEITRGTKMKLLLLLLLPITLSGMPPKHKPDLHVDVNKEEQITPEDGDGNVLSVSDDYTDMDNHTCCKSECAERSAGCCNSSNTVKIAAISAVVTIAGLVVSLIIQSQKC